MKNTTPVMSRWRVRALLCCAASVLLAACGAGNQPGLSNGPQMAAVEVASTEPAVLAGSTEPATQDPVPEAAVAALPSVPAAPAADAAPAPSAPAAVSGSKADAFALSGY